ncbi:hypothetical protein [Nautilia lithotrophica]
MNANDFFEQYSIEIINKRTRISPISLRYIKNKEFEKIQRVKFLGFIRIIEKEFNVDLSELIEEYNQATNHTITSSSNINETKLQEPKKHNTLMLSILAVVLFSLGAYLLYNKYNSLKSSNINELNKTTFIPTDENTTSQQPLQEQDNNSKQINIEKNTSFSNVSNIKSQPIAKEQTNNTPKTTIPKNIEIYPNEKVWFKAINLDNNKTLEYLTSNPKTLIGPNWYVKFGHGNITINYGNQTITPDTKKIVRILFQNGKIEYLKKPNRYEK